MVSKKMEVELVSPYWKTITMKQRDLYNKVENTDSGSRTKKDMIIQQDKRSLLQLDLFKSVTASIIDSIALTTALSTHNSVFR